MKADELRDYSKEDLERRLGEERDRLFHLRFQQGLEQSASKGEASVVRREIARILTILKERDIVGERAAEA